MKVDIKDVIVILERHLGQESFVRIDSSPTRRALDELWEMERNAEPATVALSEVILDLEQDAEREENQRVANVLRRIVAQLKMVDML